MMDINGGSGGTTAPTVNGSLQVQAIENYNSCSEGDLTLKKGEIRNVIETNGEFWKGELVRTGEVGLFSSNYVIPRDSSNNNREKDPLLEDRKLKMKKEDSSSKSLKRNQPQSTSIPSSPTNPSSSNSNCSSPTSAGLSLNSVMGELDLVFAEGLKKGPAAQMSAQSRKEKMRIRRKSASIPSTSSILARESEPLDPTTTVTLSRKNSNLGPKNLITDPKQLFDLMDVLGKGNYGTVYRAVNKETGSEVAIKIIQDALDEEHVKKELLREINILKLSKDTPYLPMYYGTFKSEHSVWIAMELCAVGSLRNLIVKVLPSESGIAAILKQVVGGLCFLHSQKIIHRDIKAANILVGTTGLIKLADFGVSAQLERTLDKQQTGIGTPHWMAPEIFMQLPYTSAVDIWSLGIMAIEIAEKNPPNYKLDPLVAVWKIVTEGVDPPTFQKPDAWSSSFKDWVNSCLVRDPEKRGNADSLSKHAFLTQITDEQNMLLQYIEKCNSLAKKTEEKVPLEKLDAKSKKKKKVENELEAEFHVSPKSNSEVHKGLFTNTQRRPSRASLEINLEGSKSVGKAKRKKGKTKKNQTDSVENLSLLASTKVDSPKKKKRASIGFLDSPKQSPIVYKDPREPEFTLRSLEHANLDGLLEAIQQSLQEGGHKYPGLVETFILNHSYFIDAKQLALRLIGSFSTEIVAKLFLVWMDTHIEEFMDEVSLIFNKFLTSINKHTSVADHLKSHFEKKRKELEEKCNKELEQEQLVELETEKGTGAAHTIFKRIPDFNILASATSEQMALQLTLVDARTLRQIPLRDYLHTSWKNTTSKSGSKKPNSLSRFIERCNRASLWIATCVMVVSHDKKKRTKMIEFWIEVTSKCLSINNFQTAFVIFHGLNLTPVQRLKWEEELPRKSKAMHHEIQEIFDPDGMFKQYRTKMAKVGPPAIPLISVLLRDLAYVEENPSKTERQGEQVFCLNKIIDIHEVVSMLVKNINPGYLFPDQGTAELNKMCVQLPCLTENELYEFGKQDDKKLVLQYHQDFKDAKDLVALLQKFQK